MIKEEIQQKMIKKVLLIGQNKEVFQYLSIMMKLNM